MAQARTHGSLWPRSYDTFVGEAGEQLAKEVRHAIAADLTIFMPHENL